MHLIDGTVHIVKLTESTKSRIRLNTYSMSRKLLKCKYEIEVSPEDQGRCGGVQM